MAQDTQTVIEGTIGASSAESAVLTDELGQEYKQNAALMPCGTAVYNVYDAYAAGAKAEREACAKEVEDYAKRHARDDDDTKAQAWMMLQCASQILKRSNV